MLGLKLPTDPRWANIVEKNISEILIDHAWCEHKAATNAMNLIVSNPEHADLVTDLLQIAKEEMEHFDQVHQLIIAKGFTLGPEVKDVYVGELFGFMKKGGSRTQQLVERLLFSALIEARSCERFRVLSEEIQDQQLASFYYELMVSEANHYSVFLGYARKFGDGMEVNERWQEWLTFEAEVIQRYGKKETIHG
jgi:tRNA-(ms[2]io[6]A)-hydroxylase